MLGVKFLFAALQTEYMGESSAVSGCFVAGFSGRIGLFGMSA